MVFHITKCHEWIQMAQRKLLDISTFCLESKRKKRNSRFVGTETSGSFRNFSGCAHFRRGEKLVARVNPRSAVGVAKPPTTHRQKHTSLRGCPGTFCFLIPNLFLSAGFPIIRLTILINYMINHIIWINMGSFHKWG